MASTYPLLSLGSGGSAVRELQEALNRHGYGLAVDGVFGDKTKAAVRDYQAQNGLKKDGVVGEETWGSLLSANPQETAIAAPAVSANTAAALEKLEQGYQPSADAQAAKDYADSFVAFEDYTSAFDDQLAALYEEMNSREAFSYDPAADAAFQSYLKRYARQGKAAMEDTVAQGAHLSGGYGSSYAQSAGAQAYNDYLARLSDVLPQLQEAAYRRYTDEGAALLESYKLLSSRDEADYEKYLQRLKAWQSERDAAVKAAEALSDDERRQYELLLDYFADKAAAEGKGQTLSATTPTAATVGSTLSSRGAESLYKAMTNYLKSGDTAAAEALFRRYDSRISPQQRTRFVKLMQGYNIAL
ncbi:MAG: peptidoglycan-binding protein [Oscillospiraceae bacterium]|nr:peptidoglycan-binding protein [Oscillospiraceae bacterium]